MVLEKTVRIVIDIAMIAMLLCAYAFQIIGEVAHIRIGIVLFILFALHIFINRHWFKTLFKGKYTPRRIVMTAVNIVLIPLAVILMVTGILEARWDNSFLQFEGDVTLRELHTTTAYWFWTLIGVHLGLHWGMFTQFISKNKFIIIVMRILACLFAVFGVWSFFDRDMFAKLFLGFSFDYWSQERPIILFFVQTLSLMGIYVFVTYYVLKLFSWLKNKKSKNTNGVFL